MKNLIVATGLLFSLTASSGPGSVTLSGLSSGAYFANQFHVAYSHLVEGAAILAGGPYWCAKGDIVKATNSCMNVYMGLPRAQESLSYAQQSERAQGVDELENLKKSRAYVLFGTLDKTVDPKVGQVLVDFYKLAGVSEANLKVESKLAVGHAFPTLNFGNACSAAATSPFLSKCKRDIAGEFLQHLMGPLKLPVAAIDSNFSASIKRA